MNDSDARLRSIPSIFGEESSTAIVEVKFMNRRSTAVLESTSMRSGSKDEMPDLHKLHLAAIDEDLTIADADEAGGAEEVLRADRGETD